MLSVSLVPPMTLEASHLCDLDDTFGWRKLSVTARGEFVAHDKAWLRLTFS